MRRFFNVFRMFAGLATAMMVAAPLSVSAEPVRILVLGDSLTAGYDLDAEAAFPAQLEVALANAGVDATVVNAGVSGDTTAGGRARLGWLMAEGAPDLLIVELGANDGLRAVDPVATRANLAAIIEEGQAAGAHVLLTGMLAPPNFGREYGEAFNSIFPDLAAEYDVTFYPFFLEGVAGVPSLNQDDGIHPTAKGVGVVVENILPTVLDALDEID